MYRCPLSRELSVNVSSVQGAQCKCVNVSSVRELSAEMVRCRGELSAMELELLHLRKDSSSKASQLCQMEEEIQQTHGLLKKKSETGMFPRHTHTCPI